MMHLLDSTNSTEDVLNNAPVGCALIGTSDYTFLNVNNRFCRLCGYEKDEIIGQTIERFQLSVQHSNDRSFQDLMQLQESFQNVPVRLRRPSGDWCELMSSGKLIANDGDSHLFGMFVDQTREKQLQRRLLEARQEERRRIGEDLKQWLAQMLTGIELLGVSLADELEDGDSPLEAKARQLNNYIRKANSFTSELTDFVLPVEMDSEGLPAALKRLSRLTREIHDVDCFVTTDGAVRIPNHTTATVLYEVADEAIKHAVGSGSVSTIELTIRSDEDYARLTVSDDSTAEAENWTQQADARDALSLLRHHVSLLNGFLHINRSTNGSPRISCMLPQASPADLSRSA